MTSIPDLAPRVGTGDPRATKANLRNRPDTARRRGGGRRGRTASGAAVRPCRHVAFCIVIRMFGGTHCGCAREVNSNIIKGSCIRPLSVSRMISTQGPFPFSVPASRAHLAVIWPLSVT